MSLFRAIATFLSNDATMHINLLRPLFFSLAGVIILLMKSLASVTNMLILLVASSSLMLTQIWSLLRMIHVVTLTLFRGFAAMVSFSSLSLAWWILSSLSFEVFKNYEQLNLNLDRKKEREIVTAS